MAHIFEIAPSGRARCRGCGSAIVKEALRFGERLPNPFAEGEITHWYHPVCAAYKRPEAFLEGATENPPEIEELERLREEAAKGVAHRRLPRLDGAQRAPTGRARCRSCKERIDKDLWRLPLVFYEEGRFQPSGFLHDTCCADYFETNDVIARVRHFAADLSEEEIAEVGAFLAGGAAS